MVRKVSAALVVLVATVAAAPSTHAVIVMGDPGRLTIDEVDAPDNLSTYVGKFADFLGTPIGPRHIAVAAHVGSSPTFLYADGGVTEMAYTIQFAGREQDLAIYELAADQPDFTHYAPLYRGADEVGLPLVVLGRGTDRSIEVRLPDEPTGELRGWRWGNADKKISWGTNTVRTIETDVDPERPQFGGDMLLFSFDAGAGPTEAALSSGDSSGPVFVLDADNVWKLAGVSSLVETGFAYAEGGPYFNAALYDMRGFWYGTVDEHELLGSDLDPYAADSYATRIASRLAFIDGITGVPEPGTLVLLGVAGAGLMVRRRR